MNMNTPFPFSLDYLRPRHRSSFGSSWNDSNHTTPESNKDHWSAYHPKSHSRIDGHTKCR
jgi:hypothetical protein